MTPRSTMHSFRGSGAQLHEWQAHATIRNLSMPSPDDTTNTTATPPASQTIRFTRYQRTVLPVDGFVFWVATGETQDVSGTIQITTDSELTEGQAYSQSTIVLTTETESHPFHDLSPDTIWTGSFQGIRFAISSRSSQYDQAGMVHYQGSSLSPAFQNQFIDDPAALQKMEPVTSSSLAIFLAIPTLGSAALDWCPWPSDVPVFPSFAVPDNQPLPYVTVHNEPAGGQSVSMSMLDPQTSTTYRLMTETVRLRLYGLPHQQAENLLSHILHWALLHDDRLGITNSPHIRDEKQSSAAINALAMSKSIELEVMYSQTAARDMAMQLIRHVAPTLSSSPTRIS